ncbi:heavy metal translocating P-type ATPase [Urechidicola vernalis]|uniref:Heavy metal translocating P-type ATPase metal-binding domain-containing protein n=1 Tax=Urechidicola vernalis TaxID=3075600 RepID=A0ABU2Y3V8_9FLAO|nr:heavy metal translocating P-type ATPase metal-binding domain-containing protein [Urechidicola sp. P050]MDT0552888.1 heavy metal translocating P-type ATPase metal-binding domain-containing protein [Urechidicola sp. P050]
MNKHSCFHCGIEHTNKVTIAFADKNFCCNGCKTVFEIFNESELTDYYSIEKTPGKIPEAIQGKYDYLTNESIVEKLLEFQDDELAIVTLHIPYIHCSSCIWILENLNRLLPAVSSSTVNFPKKTARIIYKKSETDLKGIAELLGSIGYDPYISLESIESNTDKKLHRELLYKIAVAGFAFGNSMLMAFPEYFEVDEFWLNQYKTFFRWLIFAFSVPVVFYAGRDYFVSAFKGLRKGLLNIDVPISLGISVLFIRSTIEIIFDLGQGYFDSMNGLVFFLLLGKFFQQRTYNFLSFERDYKSYFPIAVTRVKNKIEEVVQIIDIEKGDRLLIRSQELIPIDGIIIKGNASIDYSFVTGESTPVAKESGDKIYAGGKQLNGVIEIEAFKTVSQSYLTQLWSNDVFNKKKNEHFKGITDKISKNFTIAVLLIAAISGAYWFTIESYKAINVITAVLIIACPCALALSAPFTLGNMLRIFGRHKFYLKNATVIENLADINHLIFDKTGTITSTDKHTINFEGDELTTEEFINIKSLLRNSNHPLSRMLYDFLPQEPITTSFEFNEIIGKGIEGIINEHLYKLGSASLVNKANTMLNETAIHIEIDGNYRGKFIFKNNYRKGTKELFNKLQQSFKLSILSGDNDGEKETLSTLLSNKTELHFNQKPEDKLDHIKNLQENKDKVLMLGDGLNDAGALAQSNVGIAISENINVFSPACDGIIDASVFEKIPLFLKLAKQSITVIKFSFIFSFVYNIIGLYFAVTGQLSPIIAAILMPLSSISIVTFVTICTNYIGQKLKA